MAPGSNAVVTSQTEGPLVVFRTVTLAELLQNNVALPWYF
jgi:hypothetical protein